MHCCQLSRLARCLLTYTKPDKVCRLCSLESDGLHLSHALRQLVFAKLEQIINTLFAKVHTLDIRDILRRCPADPARHDHGINLEYDAVINDLVNGERDEIVVLY